jgi:ribonuclease Z
MWLMGRRAPLTVHGLHYTLDRIEVMLGLYGWSEWPNFFPVSFQPLPMEEKMLVLECSECVVHASPVKHFIPGIGLRFDFPPLGKALAYSSDTEPCPQVVKLASGVDVLIHEASGALPGHSSALQAADIARQAGARELLLIHYPATISAHADLVAEACQVFPGQVQLAEDLQVLSFE